MNSRPLLERRIALLIDFENIVRSVNEQFGRPVQWRTILKHAEQYGRVTVRRAYADWSNYQSYQQELLHLGFDLIHVASYHGKNAADIRLVIDAVDLTAQSEDSLTHFMLVTGDSDFTDLAHYLRMHGKMVIGLGVRASSATLLINACDEFLFYDEFEQQPTVPLVPPYKNDHTVSPSTNDGDSESSSPNRPSVEEYLQAIATKVRMTASPHRPLVILRFYSFIKRHPGHSLTTLKRMFHEYHKEHHPETPQSIVNEVIHQIFHTYCLSFAPATHENQGLWDREVALSADIDSGPMLLRKCDKGLLSILARNLHGTPIDPEVATEMLYGSCENSRAVQHVKALLDEIMK